MSDLEVQGLRLVSEHIFRVQKKMAQFMDGMCQRMIAHDQSKFSPAELDLVMGKPRLDKMDYTSDEYKAVLVEVQGAVSAHYKSNNHHPEHFARGIEGMSLLDLAEMVCDWKAAGEMSKNGNIWDSIEFNTKRYNIPPAIVDLLKNTVIEMGWND